MDFLQGDEALFLPIYWTEHFWLQSLVADWLMNEFVVFYVYLKQLDNMLEAAER